jgi:FtsP/CotA-like multicopper oxidase with cupredoxin domain
VWFGAVLGAIALVFAAVALVVGGDGGDGSGASGGGGATATLELTEFALTPAAVTVSAGGQLEVVNNGSVPHNVSVEGTDVATADLAAGESETLDLSALAPGDYTIICTIAGHADSGMTGTLTVTEGGGGGGGGTALAATGGDAATDHSAHGGGEMTEADYQAMSDAMNDSMLEFPAETEGTGNQILEPEVKADGTKVFELTASITEWEVEPGKFVDAWTYNGTVPGPQMHVEVGDKVEIVLNNELPMGTDLHIHGINLPNDMDGVAPLTQDLIEPGESFTYSFTTDEVAVAMYHPHHHAQMTMPDGMVGSLFVGDVAIPAGRTISGREIPADVRVAQEIPMLVNDSGVIGYALNGKSFPATEPIAANTGDWVLLHYFNHGNQIHPMHLHQFDQVVIAKDGFPLDEPYVADVVNVAPGERYSVLVKLDKPGTWVWHCHILNHVESEEGMFGMVTAVIVS